ncbi:hypothetical protein J3B02_000241 [Coemansia erecta]|nr:hypothetical protein J3B02_000241 [Coemansia erecta]KAJ2882505.1 hypothetical protein FB639_002378 [Coemansia asiatica]
MIHLKGSCHCGQVEFEFDSETPVPFMRCFCSICRKTSGGGGYTANIMGLSKTLVITKGSDKIKSYRAIKDKTKPLEEQQQCQDRFFCPQCASYLWAYSDEWKQWIYPYASAIDTPMKPPPATASIMLESAAEWADPRKLPRRAELNQMFDEYPDFSLEMWHKEHGELV